MIGILVTVIAGLYIVAVFSDIPFIVKWRTIYIETAMSTYKHQWLATKLIPKDIIDTVLKNKEKENSKIDKLVEQWKDVKVFTDEETAAEKEAAEQKDEQARFFEKFWEVDKTTFDQYISSNPNLLANGYDNLYINKSRLTDSGTTIKTIMGEQVMAIDAKNNILIVRVHDHEYDGRLAIIKDASQVKLGISSKFGKIGEFVGTIAKDNGAILGINASGFLDPNWNGNGGKPVGLVIKDQEILNKSQGGKQIMIGFDICNNLRIGKYDDTTMFRDAVEFRPPLVLNGEKSVEGTAGWGIQPRTAIGQSINGEVLLLIIDGRQVGHSIGADMGQCADIMLQHKALQAAAVDGGSSSVMVYEGEAITKPSTKHGAGRHVPDAFIVTPATKSEYAYGSQK